MKWKYKPRIPVHISRVEERLPQARCPRCDKLVDGATGISFDGRPITPKPDDYSVCLYCGAFNRYTEDLGLREMTKEELAAIPPGSKMGQLLAIGAYGALLVRNHGK